MQQTSMPTAVETQPDQESNTSVAASYWSPPNSYQFSTSTQRNADAARDALDDNDQLSEADWDEHWRIHTQDIY